MSERKIDPRRRSQREIGPETLAARSKICRLGGAGIRLCSRCAPISLFPGGVNGVSVELWVLLSNIPPSGVSD